MLARLVTLAVVIAGLSCIAIATNGFRVVTAEGQRRIEIERNPRRLPSISMIDHDGHTFDWESFRGQTVLVEFIFTTCPDICQRMSSEFAALSRDTERPVSDQIRLLSISFDPENDSLERLSDVAQSFGASAPRWRFARIESVPELAATLEAFGIVVIPSAIQGFEHNTAIHGIDPNGRLAKIVDIDAQGEILAWARSEPGT